MNSNGWVGVGIWSWQIKQPKDSYDGDRIVENNILLSVLTHEVPWNHVQFVHNIVPADALAP